VGSLQPERHVPIEIRTRNPLLALAARKPAPILRCDQAVAVRGERRHTAGDTA